MTLRTTSSLNTERRGGGGPYLRQKAHCCEIESVKSIEVVEVFPQKFEGKRKDVSPA